MREVRPGTSRVALPRFKDDRWDCAATDSRPNNYDSSYVLDFSAIHDSTLKLLLKEFAFARLNERRPRRGRFLSARSAIAEVQTIVRLTRFIVERGSTFAQVGQADLDAFVHKRIADRVSRDVLRNDVRAIKHLWRLAPRLSVSLPALDPWRGRSARTVVGGRSPLENSTPRIPESVMAPYLAAALFYVEVASRDILDARDEVSALIERLPHLRSDSEKLAGWISERRSQMRGIPMLHRTRLRVHGLSSQSTSGSPNFHLTALLAGVAPRSMRRKKHRQLVESATDELGLESGGLETEISIDPRTGRPWRDRFSPRDVQFESLFLLTACYVVTAYLSGMRDSEVQGAERGAISEERSEDGLVERIKLQSRVYKDKGLDGERAKWVVIAPVQSAIEVLERLSQGSSLFEKNFCGSKTKGTIRSRINSFLNYFAKRATELGFVVPEVDGSPWRFSTRQFRRTLAWHIANQPFGVVAGMIQYKHASIAMFEGYAGTSASGFRAEVEIEQALARMDDVVESYERYKKGIRLSGPGSKAVEAAFESARQTAGDLPGSVVDERRLRMILKKLAETLYPAALNDCYFDASKARCLSKAKTTDRSVPLANQCEPNKCANSCIAAKHLGAWKLQKAAIESLSARPLSPLQRTAVDIRRREIEAVLEETPSGPE